MGEGSGGLVVAGLSKVYGSHRAVDDVSFACRRGSVTGFVGPNGSGKSTTLRMIVGHSRASSGSATFDGTPLPDLPQPGLSVGVLLDASAHHPGRSVFETAYLAAILIGVGKRRVRECLEAVGVDGVRNRRVGSLSLGMRQRLGLAIAVMGAPEYLILDEPANGLDPEGIHWLRMFLRGFADGGGCALVSSHQLNELDAAADAVLVIDRGRVVQVGDRTHAQPLVRVWSVDDSRLRAKLGSEGIECRDDDDNPGFLASADPEAIGILALRHGIALRGLALMDDGLESWFLGATSGEFAGLSGARLLDVVRGRKG